MEAILFGSLTGTVVLALVIIDDIAEPDRGANRAALFVAFRVKG